MKITEIRTHKLAIPTKGRYNWALGAPAGANSVLVEVHTDSGIVGYGESRIGCGPAPKILRQITRPCIAPD